MNKNVIIAALAALIIGIGIGFSMAQVNRAGVGEPSAVSASARAESGASQDSAASSSASVSQDPTASSSMSSTSETDQTSAASSSASASQDSAAQSSANQGSANDAESSASAESSQNSSAASQTSAGVAVEEGGTYTSKEEVAAYIHEFGHLPSNYISKSKAKKAGWVSNKGNLDEVLPGMSIGGSEFYNDEGLLPDAPGRTWTECDINYEGGYRGAERIVFSNDGLIFYTADHYKTFEQVY